MNKKQQRNLGPLALVLFLAAAGGSVAYQMKSSEAGHTTLVTPATSESAGLRKVEDVKKVCMITNRVFDKDQIPVEVAGKTYYGCCPACKDTLSGDPASRLAIDPMSGSSVDKATAVIGVQADGSVLYFESEASLQKYASKHQG